MLAACEVQREKVRTPLEKISPGINMLLDAEPHVFAEAYQMEKNGKMVIAKSVVNLALSVLCTALFCLHVFAILTVNWRAQIEKVRIPLGVN